MLGQANVSFSSLTHWYFSKMFDADLRFETLEELALEFEDRHRPQASTASGLEHITCLVLYHFIIYIRIPSSHGSFSACSA